LIQIHNKTHVTGFYFFMHVSYTFAEAELEINFNTFRAAWFRRFSKKNSSFRLPYQRLSSSARCARELLAAQTDRPV